MRCWGLGKAAGLVVVQKHNLRPENFLERPGFVFQEETVKKRRHGTEEAYLS